jgi:hypothetical protein
MSAVMRMAITMGVLSLGAMAWPANSTEWLADLPRELRAERLAGSTEVNGVPLQLATASSALAPQYVSDVILATWRATSASVATQTIGHSRVLSRHVLHWHDTATLVANESGGTRITFSRFDLRNRTRRMGCSVTVPRGFQLRSHTRSAIGAGAASQCVFASSHSPSFALRVLASHWRTAGWQTRGEALWFRGTHSFRVVAVDAAAGSLIMVLGEPESPQ